ncbi:hypothetical protein [Comamonas sp. 26]|uniref:hypothetical protein n=1 Tax=Comamonas sp. 26 TaxID=2035201 RepID=UPI000C1A488E|nr:hypothetical protein [Comamonas sp. 26]PIG09512.1 hypothetical protein CLU84_2427 [Comamonas sp. 26]
MSKLPWFRTYARMVDDDKLKLLAFEDRWHFVALLCLKGEGLLDKGDAPALLMRKVAVKLGLDVRSLEEVARRLAEVGLIEQATLQPSKWATLQMRSDVDTTAADRKRRQRQRKKDAGSEGEEGGHEQVTGESRVTGTDVTRTDTDIDKEETVNNLKAVGGADRDTSPAAPPSQARTTGKTATGTRLPDDWKLPKSWGEWAIAEHPALTEDEIRRQAAMFADHWHGKAGKDGRKADWGATWRNWIRRATEMPATRRPAMAPTAAAGGKHAGAMAAILGGLQ